MKTKTYTFDINEETYKIKIKKTKTYTFDINEETYKIKIKKTLIIDQIPHSSPSLMGRVTYQHDKLLHFDSLVFSKLKFDFAIERPSGLSEDIIDLVPCFNSSVIHLSPTITETIKTCIKNYYHEFLSTLK